MFNGWSYEESKRIGRKGRIIFEGKIHANQCNLISWKRSCPTSSYTGDTMSRVSIFCLLGRRDREGEEEEGNGRIGKRDKGDEGRD